MKRPIPTSVSERSVVIYRELFSNLVSLLGMLTEPRSGEGKVGVDGLLLVISRLAYVRRNDKA
jgi:hypothetical protein